MEIIKTIVAMQAWSRACHDKGESLSFVPTMGNLHTGHLVLVNRAKELADKVVVSIYVNPTQFGENEDFNKYPRTEQQDLNQLKKKNVDVVFMPGSDEMYPSDEAIDYVDVPDFAKELEGLARPEHFRGVATIVKKLFDAVQPDHAVFGEKDFQQCMLVNNMVADSGLDIDIHVVPIVRDDDGVAKSSRNQYLTPEQRKLAPLLYQSLLTARQKIIEGQLSYTEIESQSIEFISKNTFDVDYFVIRDATTLGLPGKQSRVILVAAKLGIPRLLDNLRVD